MPHIQYLHMGAFPLYVGFTTSEKAYAKEMARLGVSDAPAFVTAGASATVHSFECDGRTTSIICLCRVRAKGKKASQIAALLAHEAVHVKQRLVEAINERDPGAEFEAYTVQWITQFCIEKYAEGR